MIIERWCGSALIHFDCGCSVEIEYEYYDNSSLTTPLTKFRPAFEKQCNKHRDNSNLLDRLNCEAVLTFASEDSSSKDWKEFFESYDEYYIPFPLDKYLTHK